MISLEDCQLKDYISNSSFCKIFLVSCVQNIEGTEQKMKIIGTAVKQFTGKKRSKF